VGADLGQGLRALPDTEAQRYLRDALAREAEAQRMLLEGDLDAARAAYREVSDLYRGSWERAHERAFGRLVGMLKAAILAGGGKREAAYLRGEVPEADSPSSGYALALADLTAGDDPSVEHDAAAMRGDSEAFGLAANAVSALARRDQGGYENALRTIVADFEARSEHLTGVPIADTACVLERLAAARGMAVGLHSPLVPAT
jgi:hypothetical protein